MNLRKIAASSAVAFAITAAGAMAAPLDMRNVSFTWGTPTGGLNLEYVNNGTGSAEIRWGGNTATADKSGYNITVASDPVPSPGVDIDTDFILGSFTHYNQPIPSGSAITGVSLSVAADVFDNGIFQEAVTFTFDFVHNETTNASPCSDPDPNGSVCDDIVTVTLSSFSDSFTGADGLLYTLDIIGFLQGGTPTNIFYSAEGGTNSADVSAVFRATVIPLPAAGWLLLAGVGGLAAMRRRKKAA